MSGQLGFTEPRHLKRSIYFKTVSIFFTIDEKRLYGYHPRRGGPHIRRMKTTARLLSEFIEKRSITFTSLSESVGISRPTLNLLLTGRQPISLERAKKIADALSIDDTELKLLYAALERESEALASHARFKQRLVFSKTALPLMLKVFEASQQLDEPLDSTAMEGIEHPVYLGWADLRSKEIEKIRT